VDALSLRSTWQLSALLHGESDPIWDDSCRVDQVTRKSSATPLGLFYKRSVTIDENSSACQNSAMPTLGGLVQIACQGMLDRTSLVGPNPANTPTFTARISLRERDRQLVQPGVAIGSTTCADPLDASMRRVWQAVAPRSSFPTINSVTFFDLQRIAFMDTPRTKGEPQPH
jgi:hypothetical protein